jgi:hypothetical protein
VDAVLLVSGDGGCSASAGQLGARTGRLASWVAGLRDAGILREGGHIAGPVLRLRTSGGDTALIDMPADVGGGVHTWLLVSVPDMDAAVGVARSCPEAPFGDIRVLPLDPQGRLP